MSIPQRQTKSGLGELMMRVKGTNYAGGGRNQWILMYSVMCPMMSYDSDVS